MIEKIITMGRNISQVQDKIDKSVQIVPEKRDKNDEPIQSYIIKVIFDLTKKEISFDFMQYESGKEKEYNYLKTPKGTSNQFPLVRNSYHIGIFFGKMFYDFKEKLQALKNDISNETYELLIGYYNDIIKSGLYDENNRAINLNKVKNESVGSLQKLIKDNEFENKFIKNKIIKNIKQINIAFYIPVIKVCENEIYLSALSQYRDLYLKASLREKSKNQAVCLVCNEKKHNIIEDISFREHAKIARIFTTTTINSSSHINGDYLKNYTLCQDCMELISVAEDFIDKRLKFKIAGLDTYLIPFLYIDNKAFPYQKTINVIKKKTDLVFQTDNLMDYMQRTKRQLDKLDEDDKIWKESIFDISFLTFKDDGQSFKIINIIESISKFNFERIIQMLSKQYNVLIRFDKVSGFNLNRLYKLVPLKSEKKEKNELLLLYNNLFKLTMIKKELIFTYFCTAIQHRYLHHGSPKEGVYKNLFNDFNIEEIISYFVFNYLIIINSFKELNLFYEKEGCMEERADGNEMDKFPNDCKYTDQQKALFYLGQLISKVAYAQKRHGHYNLPILNKIYFQGMSVKELERLYLDVFDKIKQYSGILITPKLQSEEVHSLLKKFHQYFDEQHKNWNLSNQENVFYMLSGYAYAYESKKDKKEGENQ